MTESLCWMSRQIARGGLHGLCENDTISFIRSGIPLKRAKCMYRFLPCALFLILRYIQRTCTGCGSERSQMHGLCTAIRLMTDLKSKGHWMAATFQCQLQRWRPMPPRTQLVLVDKFRFSLFAPLTASSTTRPSCYQASSSIRRLPPAFLGSQRSAERYVWLSLSLAPQVAPLGQPPRPRFRLGRSQHAG